MNEQITDADIQAVLALNPMAAEQLRRIMAERQREELATELSVLRANTKECLCQSVEVNGTKAWERAEVSP